MPAAGEWDGFLVSATNLSKLCASGASLVFVASLLLDRINNVSSAG